MQVSRVAAPDAISAVIIDDSAVARSILSRALRLSGIPIARILEAPDGQKGLELLEREKVSLAFVDLNMPVMGGMEMLEKARAKPELSRLPMVVVSTEGSETQIAKVRDLGAGFLRKPFTPESLVETVQTILASQASREHDRTLFQVSARVLAELCFLLPQEDATSPEPEETVNVTVRYSGASAGQLTLGFGGLDLAAIAGEMMGIAPEDAFADDAALELANVICGHMLPLVYGNKAVFRLAPPKLGVAGVSEEPLLAEAVLRLGGGQLRAKFYGRSTP